MASVVEARPQESAIVGTASDRAEGEGEQVGWIIATGILGLIVVMLASVYRLALRENRALANYVLLILLDDGVHDVQRNSLAEFVRTTEARNAADLKISVSLATTRLAEKLSDTGLGVAGLLWKLKKGS
jgi:hypothetical protein